MEKNRYIVTISFYMWEKDDETVIEKAQKYVDKIDSKEDNTCELESIVEQPFGRILNRDVFSKERKTIL
jgi:hypothetical protein